LSITDIIGIVTAFILLFTLLAIKKSNEENSRLNRLQSAENTIIKQLEFHADMLKGISINIALTGRGFGAPNMPVNAYGQEAFELFYDILKDSYITMPGNSFKGADDIEAEENRIKDSFTALYNDHGSKFGNYFENLYLLVAYIHDRTMKDFDKDYYIDLVKAQLSKYEILLLAYDCIWIQDKPKGRNFIEFAKQYNLLSALETKELIVSVSAVKHEDIFKDKYGIQFRKPMEFTN
jgi:hypothetical protein